MMWNISVIRILAQWKQIRPSKYIGNNHDLFFWILFYFLTIISFIVYDIDLQKLLFVNNLLYFIFNSLQSFHGILVGF